MLTTEKLNQYYGGSHTLWDIDLDVPDGSCVCLMGRNGVGKTTLLKVIMGILPAASGKVKFGATELTGRPPELRARSGIGYVPQGREIFAQLTVEENLRIANGSIPEKVLTLFPALKKMMSRRGGDLSGGQQQQLAIGRALVTRPRLLVLDEPTEGIQPSIIKDIGRAIAYLRAKGDMAILLVEQYFDFARELADRFVVMERGEIIESGDRTALAGDDVRQRLAF
jgi:urea transport system ATP-binding protein